MPRRNRKWAHKAGACRKLLTRVLDAVRPRDQRGSAQPAHRPEPTWHESREAVDFQCACGYPLTAVIGRGWLVIVKRADASGRRPATLSTCPNCRRDLVPVIQLGAEAFLDRLQTS